MRSFLRGFFYLARLACIDADYYSTALTAAAS